MRLPDEVPVMVLPSATLFPGTLLPLFIFENRYRRMLGDVLDGSRVFAVAMQNPERVRESPCKIAGIGLVRASVTHRNGTSNLVLQGIGRVHLKKVIQYNPYRMHQMVPIEPGASETSDVVRRMSGEVVDRVRELLDTGLQLPNQAMGQLSGAVEMAAESLEHLSADRILEQLQNMEDPEQRADLVSSTLLTRPAERQVILETLELEPRLALLSDFLVEEIRRRKENLES